LVETVCNPYANPLKLNAAESHRFAGIDRRFNDPVPTTNLGVRSSNLFGRANVSNDLTGRASRINIFADPMRTRRRQGRSARDYKFAARPDDGAARVRLPVGKRALGEARSGRRRRPGTKNLGDVLGRPSRAPRRRPCACRFGSSLAVSRATATIWGTQYAIPI
jgi:hypothetical protein